MNGARVSITDQTGKRNSKKGYGSLNVGHDDVYLMIDRLRERYPQKELLSCFGLARSSYQYYCEHDNKDVVEDGDLKQKVVQIYNDSRGSAGSRTISGILKQQGKAVGRYRARSLMKTLGFNQ